MARQYGHLAGTDSKGGVALGDNLLTGKTAVHRTKYPPEPGKPNSCTAAGRTKFYYQNNAIALLEIMLNKYK